MIMEVMTPSPPVEFNFDSASTSPFISAPGSPQPFGIPFYSAPTSPTRVSPLYTDFDDFSSGGCDSPAVVLPRKEKDEIGDFEFNFGGLVDKTSPLSAADELFHGGQIKPFEPSSKPPLTVEQQAMGELEDSQTQKSPEFPTSKNNFGEIERGRKEEERNYKGSRSLPTYRISDMLLEKGNEKSGASKLGGWRGWRLKDMLLFRSASDGRAMEKHPLKKYELLKKEDQPKGGGGGGDSRKGSGPPPPAMSAHEIHYTANRAASEEKKRRTFLPYKQTLLGGCLGFNPALHHPIPSFGSSTRTPR